MKGACLPGYKAAGEFLSRMLKRSIADMVPMHSPYEWIWGELIRNQTSS